MSGKSDGTWTMKSGEIHADKVGGKGELRQLRIGLAEDRDVVAERAAGRDVVVDGRHTARPWIA